MWSAGAEVVVLGSVAMAVLWTGGGSVQGSRAIRLTDLSGIVVSPLDGSCLPKMG